MKWPETLIPHFPWACRDLPSKGAQLPRAPHGSEGRSMGTGAGAGPYHPPDPPPPIHIPNRTKTHGIINQ